GFKYYASQTVGVAPFGIPREKYNNSSGLEVTTDGGLHWQPIDFFDSMNLSITELSFVSKAHGYASTINLNRQVVRPGIFETMDSGKHWRNISTSLLNSFSGVYAANGTVFASVFYGYGSFVL